MTPRSLLKGIMAVYIVLLLPVRVLSQATAVECPSTLMVRESVDLAMEGWRARDTSLKGSHHFFDVAFSEGPPEKLVYQTPSKSTATKTKKSDVYDFSSVSDDVWISCLYRDTSQSLTRNLAKKFSRCEVTYDEKTGFRTVKRINCF
jgi:hypothetical protein